MSSREKIPYEEVFRALNKAKINYVVCGGAAVVMLGFARLTVDLDLIVSLDRENLSRLYDVLLRLGYKTRVPIRKDEFIRREILAKLEKDNNMKVMSFYDPKDAFKTVDIGVNLPNIPQILKRKKLIKAGSLNIPIIFIKDLIKMKKDLARPKDIIDVENLKKLNTIKMKQENKYIDENLIYIFKNTTPYQRMVWLKKAFNFWKLMQKRGKISHSTKRSSR